jgi:hypothetical protein
MLKTLKVEVQPETSNKKMLRKSNKIFVNKKKRKIERKLFYMLKVAIEEM